MRVAMQVPDQPDENWDPNLVADGQPFVLLAGPPSSPIEVCRGRFKGHGFGFSIGEPITPRGYSLLYEMLNSKDDVVYPDQTTGGFIISDLCQQYEVPISRIDGPLVDVGPLVGRRKSIADVFTEILKRARGSGDGSWVMRWTQNGFEVVRPGGNDTVYWFVEGESILGGSGDSSIEQLITRVKIVRLDKTDSATLERDQYGRWIANTQKSEHASEITTLHGREELGILQEVVYAKKGSTDEDAITLGNAVLDMYGAPVVTATIVIPLLSDIQRGDKHHVTGGMFDGYMYVLGYSADTSTKTMQCEVASEWKDSFAQPVLDIDPDNSDAGLPPPGTTGYTPSTDIPLQSQGWTCSAASTAWMLRSVGVQATEQDVVSALGDSINSDVGLTDGSGAGLAAMLKTKYNLSARSGAVTFDQVRDMAGKLPTVMGGHNFNHWVGVRGTVDDDTLTLANSGPGWMGISGTLTRDQFDRLGPFYAVWIAQ
jgi:hypothetical protein